MFHNDLPPHKDHIKLVSFIYYLNNIIDKNKVLFRYGPISRPSNGKSTTDFIFLRRENLLNARTIILLDL